MEGSGVTRRNFINTVAATSAVTAIGPLKGFATNLPAMPAEYLAPGRKIKILDNAGLSEADQQRIHKISADIELLSLNGNNQQILEEAEIILGGLNIEQLKRAKKLKWVQLFGAGVEWMPKELIEHPVIVTNMQRTMAPVIAETAIAMLLSMTRGIAHFAVPNFNNKKWQGTPPDNIVLDDLYNKTIGIVGMGGIGTETARRLYYGFNMKVLATDAKPLHKPEFVAELHDPNWFMEMVPQVDVLMSAAPFTPRTREMFNAPVFNKMKRSAYFINVSRGGLVRQPDLIEALKSGTIRGAGLDVATPEPLPPDNPLWTAPNLVITSHNSAIADSRFERMISLVEENIKRYITNEPLLHVVDKQKGY